MQPFAVPRKPAHLVDLVGELSSVPAFLQSKEAEIWLCMAVANIRAMYCGHEEIAWLLGVEPRVLNEEELPSSAPATLCGSNLQDIGFLPRGAICSIHACREAEYLNESTCVLHADLNVGARHASVLVMEKREIFDGPLLGPPMMIARESLIYLSPPTSASNEAIAGRCEDDDSTLDGPPPPRLPSEFLGSLWVDPSLLPMHLRSKEARCWLAGVVGRLLDSRGCGHEEICHVLGLPCCGRSESPLGSAVPPSLRRAMYGCTLDHLGFVPASARCIVEGCHSREDLNGRLGVVAEACPQSTAQVSLDLLGPEGVLRVHRQHLRLLAPRGLELHYPEADVPDSMPPSEDSVSLGHSMPPGSATPSGSAGSRAHIDVDELCYEPPEPSAGATGDVDSFDWIFLGCASVRTIPAQYGIPGCERSIPAAAYSVCTSPCENLEEKDGCGAMNTMTYSESQKISADREEGYHPCFSSANDWND